ncbi:uncharacterized protein LOC129781914 [Toxorhynchites rutilus septentrionalis]|uniref:uncharacterized protein LOC129781914 n=1 Tax=Toxorhynchites rutilus septentrionalis TaxID=329112 RepID=UPI00247A8F8E|nr:uncharacterized protein LOC129781914 [Toxorhynchites rutilus septentrionalis]
MGQADLRIHDLRQNPVVILPLGPAKISHNYLSIDHPIELDPIEEVVNHLFTKVQVIVTQDQILSPMLKAKIEEVMLTFKKLSPKNNITKRWDSLGKAWKYISGSSDADDVRAINSTINSTVKEENKQIEINTGIDSRIRNTTRAINVLISNQGNLTSKINEGFNSVNLLYNIGVLTQQIETIEEAITLARFNIPSSRLISLTELTVARNFLRNQGLDVTMAEQVLEIAKSYVVTIKNSIKYTLRIPMLVNEIFSLYQVESVISNGTRIHLQYNYHLNGTTSYSSKTIHPNHRVEDTTYGHIQQLNLTTESTHGKIKFLHWLSFGSISLTSLLAIGIIVVWIIKILSRRKATIIIKEDH